MKVSYCPLCGLLVWPDEVCEGDHESVWMTGLTVAMAEALAEMWRPSDRYLGDVAG